MKNPTGTARSGLPLLFCFLLTTFACRKEDDILPPGSISVRVVATTPHANQQDAPYDENITAALNCTADTNNYTIGLTVWKGDSAVKGTVDRRDSLVIFTPETELLPSAVYTAALTVSEKGKLRLPLTHQWDFRTKAPDGYSMTQRSTRVTDFERDGTRCMQIGDYLYSFGGWRVPEESFNDVYRSTGDLSVWEKLPNAPWHGRHVFGIGNLNGYTYIIGGDYLQNGFDVWRTVNGSDWTLVSENQLNSRILYGCTVHNGYIYVVGGAGFNDVLRSRDGIVWKTVAEHIDFLRGEGFGGSLASFNGRLWMVCGGTDGYGNGHIRKEVWSSVDGKDWRRESDFPGSKRYYNDVIVWDNKLWTVGGYNYEEGNTKSIWFMRPNGRWEEYVTPRDYIGRHATGLAVYNNSLAITCGNYHNDCWVIEKVK